MITDRRLAQGIRSDREPSSGPSVEAVVALGANLGDRAASLAAAVDELARLPLTEEVRASEPVESVAVTLDGPDAAAPPYLNAVAILTTRLAPEVLLSYLHAIEERHGRVREHGRDIRVAGAADRTLDLDLVAYGDLVHDDPRLTVPHPRAAERVFVLAPWLTLDPDAALAGRGRVAELLAALDADAPWPEVGGTTAAETEDAGGTASGAAP